MRLKAYLFFILSFVSLLLSYAQEERDYAAFMRRAMREKDYELALNIYNRAEQEEYYKMEELDAELCKLFQINKEYKKAGQIAEKLYQNDDNTFITDMISFSFITKDRKYDSLVFSRLEDFSLDYIPVSALSDLEIIESKDLQRICSFVEKYTEKEELTEREDRVPYSTLLCILYFVQHKYMLAYNNAMDILSEDNIALLDFILGRLKEERKEYNSAIAFYNSAIKKGYITRDAYLHRALCKGYCSDYVEANIDLDTCLLIKEEYYAYYLKGVNYNLLRDYNNAVYHLSMSVFLCDTFADAYNYRGIVYANVKKYDFALMDFKLCYAVQPKTPYIHDNMGLALEYSGEIAKAIEEYKLSIKAEPEYFDAYYNLGRIYTQSDETDRALRYLKKALDLEKEVSDIYYLIGVNLNKKKRKQEACSYLNQALEMGHTKAEETLRDFSCMQQDAETEDKKE